MVYLYDACDQISDFCHLQLLRKMRQKISWTDEQMDRGNTVYPPPPSGSGGIKTVQNQDWVAQTSIKFKSQLKLKCKLISFTYQVISVQMKI